MFGAAQGDPLEQCPYDQSHLIFKSRMQYHLVRCAKNYPNVEKETCPYNATHRVPKPELRFHLENCPDQRILEEHKYQAEDEVTYGGVSEYVKPSLPPNDESWDEVDCTTYNPSSSVSDRVLLRPCPGATKSVRKQFYLEERKRVAESGDFDGTVALQEREQNEAPPPLRLPRAPSQALQDIPPPQRSKLGLGRGFLRLDTVTETIVSLGRGFINHDIVTKPTVGTRDSLETGIMKHVTVTESTVGSRASLGRGFINHDIVTDPTVGTGDSLRRGVMKPDTFTESTVRTRPSMGRGLIILDDIGTESTDCTRTSRGRGQIKRENRVSESTVGSSASSSSVVDQDRLWF